MNVMVYNACVGALLYLAKVPWFGMNIFLGTSVNLSMVIKDIFKP